MAKKQKEEVLKYLQDEPIELEDSPIVDAISNELKIADGKIIGLLGSWGSGKSSIIESIKKMSSFEILEYDAWKSEGYPFKLGFLKYLNNYAVKMGCNENALNEIKNKLDMLQQVKDVKEAVNYSIINIPNALIAFSFLFYPLAFKMIETNKLNPLFMFPDIKVWIFNVFVLKLIFIFGATLLLLNYLITTKQKIFKLSCPRICVLIKKAFRNLLYPLVIALVTSIFFDNLSATFILVLPIIIWLNFNAKNFIGKILGKTDEFYLLAGTKPHTESIITINKTPEPNYSDFKDLYVQILNQIKENLKNKKVIIVIDNIDRIEKDEAQNIWSCLKGMVLKDKSINIIIPIDEKQISEIYKDTLDIEQEDNKTVSFIQKTFDITFRVSPFIMTKAKYFWNKKLDEAFNNKLSDIEKDEIISIFDTRNDLVNNKTSDYSGNLTPRKIIKLINEVVSIQKIKIFEDIPIVTKFAYSLHYSNISEQLQKHQLSKLFPETNNILNNIAQNFQSDIAALYYAVPPNDAIAYVKEENLCKLIADDEYKIIEEDAKSSWIWDILFNGLVKKTNEPYSILVNTLSNLIKLNEINPSKNNYLYEKILDKISNLKTLDKIRKNDSIVLCNTKVEIYRDKILEIVKIIVNQKNDDNLINPENWIRTLISLIKKYNITKQELYRLSNKNIPDELYKEAILFLEEKDYELFDSCILEPHNLENVLKNETGENLYKHLRFIIKCSPNQDDIENWNKKMENTVFPLIQKNINTPKMYILLVNALSKKVTEPMKIFIQSDSFLLPILNIKDIAELASAFAIYLTFCSNANIARWRNISQQSVILWNKLNSSDEVFISEFVKTYLSYFDNNVLKLLELPDVLQNKEKMITYAVNNISSFSINTMEYFTIYDQYIDKYPILKNLLNEVKNENNFIKVVTALNFSDKNKQLLYVLAQETDQSTLKEEAFSYFESISEETWLTYLKSNNLNFKNALIMQYEGAKFVNTIKQNLMNLFKSNPTIFADNYKNEIPYLKQFDKKLKFINDFLDNDLTLDNYDILIEHFDDSVIAWLKKTSHKNDTETIFTNFIRKINNYNWLIKNKNIVKKFITTDDNKNNFRMQWQSNKDVLESYKNILLDETNIK